jgi:Homeodomain
MYTFPISDSLTIYFVVDNVKHWPSLTTGLFTRTSFFLSKITIIYRLIDDIIFPSFFFSFAASSARMWPYFHPYGGYLMPQCGSKRKGGQVRFTPQQTQNLERRFSNHKYLSPEDRRKLAMELSLSDRQVKTWFQNRRFVFAYLSRERVNFFKLTA